MSLQRGNEMAKKDTTIFYQRQIAICKKHFTPEQFGRLMFALFEFDEGAEPEVEEDIQMAFEFMALQKQIDREKYEEKCRKNRENGKLGGRPKKGEEKPKKANGLSENPEKTVGFSKNPNENDNENDNDKIMMNDKRDSTTTNPFGTFQNVNLTDQEHDALVQTYERPSELIDKVSIWLRGASGPVPDHYALCVKFAANDKWPRRKIIEPVEPIVVEDPLTEEEQEERVSQMRQTLGGMFEVKEA